MFCFSCMNHPPPAADTSANIQSTDSVTIVEVPKTQIKPVRTIKDVQQAYADISTKVKKGLLDSVSFKYNCNNEKDGTVSYFSEKGQLRLMVHRYNEYSHFSASDHYFVQDSMLFFVFKRSVLWSFSGPQGSTRDSITEQRTYLIKQQPVQCLQKAFVIRSHLANNPKPETLPNKAINCASAKFVMKPYRLLMKYRDQGTTGCLE